MGVVHIQGPTPVFRYTFSDDPQHLLTTAAIHGDEICGSFAAERVMALFDANEIQGLKGTVTFVPRANSVCWGKSRFQDVNLNSIIFPKTAFRNQEEVLGDYIARLIDESSMLLDLHAFPSRGIPYVFQDYDDIITAQMADSCDLEHIVTGWPALCEGTSHIDTVKYGHSIGKPGIAVECGQNSCPNAVDTGFHTILNVMQWAGVIDNKHASACNKLRKIYEVVAIIKRPEGSAFANPVENLDVFQAGETIAVSPSVRLKAKFDCGILNPWPDAKVGDEWFTLAKFNSHGPRLT